MKINYFTFTSGNSKGTSIKYLLFGLVMMLSVSFGYSQETMTITTTSDDTNWVINFTNSGGAALSWLATGPGLPPGGLTGTGNNPSFDFSGNTGNGDITIEITSTDNFDFVTVLLAPGREISDIDLANLDNLVQLEMPTNQLMDIDLEFNTALQRLDLDNNQLTSVDISNNVNLITFDASFNELNLVDVDGIPNLVFMDLSNNEITSINLSGNNQLTQINLDFNLLTTASIGQVIDQVDAYGTGGFGHILSLTGNPGDIPASSIDGVNNLLGRDWIVRPPVIYDFGDAPDSYGTTNGSGGPQHIIGDGDLYLGSVYDDELDGFPGVDADGDDNDKVADEDSVDPLDLAGISTSTDVFSVDVDYTNNTSLASNIHAWIDFDGSGSFDADEYAISPIANNSAGTVTLTWTDLVANGVDIVQGDTYARFRTTSDVLTASDPGGIVNNGEVEDYALVIELDFDEDGVPDSVDVDDDNDGILDVDEAGNTDPGTNEDRINLDADSDGCFDVVEAFTTDVIDPDPDGDGILGTSPVAVDANGQVTGQGGYTPANDLNGNSIPDFQEAGVAANITTEPTDQDLIIGDVTFTVVTDLAAGDENYQWEENIGGNTAWLPITDAAGSYAGAQTASLVVTSTDAGRVADRYRVVVSNIAYACDPETTSVDVGYITPDDFDLDGVFDIVDVDDDNDGILDVDEAGNTDPGTNEDRINLDADSDGCFDVVEAFTTDVIDPDPDGDGILGTSPVAVDANGQVTGQGGYTPANDLNGNSTPDFQEAGVAANITTEPTDQDLIIGDVTFTVVTDLAAGDENYQWEENIGGNTAWLPITDAAGFYAGAQTASLTVTNVDAGRVADRYRVVVSNIAYACDPTTTSVDVGYITPDDFDLDGVFDIVDVDDDNDGILDVDEAGNTDPGTNEDRINLDADSDGCFDVVEAFTTDVIDPDPDGDGILGTSPVAVDANGQVTGQGGYTPANDLNASGTPDFQEAGVAANITTQPVEQEYVQSGIAIFSVVSDLAVGDEFYQWQEDSGAGFVDITDGADFAGTNTADLSVTIPANFDKVFYRYRVLVRNVAYACDLGTFSTEVGFVIPGDFDRDGVFDVDDLDDDNDGILDTVEDDGVVDRDTNGDGSPDKRSFDADGDGCFDTLESGVLDGDSNGLVGTGIITSANVDADGLVVSDANGAINAPGDAYGPLNDLDNNGTADFQEEGFAASITADPTDQDFVLGGSATFTATAIADTYQWEFSTDGGANWMDVVDDANNAGATTNTLVVSNLTINEYDNNTYRLVAEYISYVCDDVPAESLAAGFNTLADFDADTVPDVVDVDDDNDGILDVTEAGNTDPGTNEDRINLDSDGDGCFDVTEALTTDVLDPDPDGDGILGTSPVVVDANGQVTGQGGYTTPNDLDNNGTPDFQEAGAAAAITTQPVDQNFIPGGAVTFDVVASADTYQWEESTDGSTWTPITDGGDYSGATTASLTISNVNIGMLGYSYRVMVNNIAYACDPVTTSDVATLVSLPDNDNDGVPDIVDVDDDNDGIFDTVEDAGPNGGDTNNNTIPDRFELDSDSDGCDDVVEAGFTDGDGDGLLGNSPVTVDPTTGQVTSGTDGYTTPNDLDNNGTFDFQEAGDVANITDDPSDQDFVLNGSASFTATSDGDTYQWEISVNGAGFVPLSDDAKYSGTSTATLIVSNLLIPDYFDEYRVVVTNIAFACDPGDTSDAASYNILDDTDNDGVFDIVDVDDDNDGIFDTVEGEVTDTNLDGRPDRISLDSDSDGCADAIEAGFTDPDGDGILGTSPVTVDANGQVTGQGGYTTPNDLDNNGVFDFQEAGEPSSIENQPEEVEIALGDDAIFEISSVATFYQWQQSMDDGNSWSDLVNDSQYSGVTTDRLLISDARGRLEGSRYRVVLSSPDYACDPNEELVSDNVRLVFNTELIPSGFSPNGDGENDLFSVPGLIETPDFSMEVFDRWGNSVYKYNNNGSLNPDWWDGRSTGNMTLSKGQLVPAGTYFYLIKYNDGNKSPDKGWVYVNY